MKKICFKIIGFVLCMILAFPVGYTAKASEISNNYYVKSGGTGDGRTVSSPASSVASVIKSVNADNLTSGDTANIFIIQREDYLTVPTGSTTHNMTCWYNEGESIPSHSATLVVQSYDVSSISYLAYYNVIGSGALSLGGPCIFKNISVVSTRSMWTSIYANGHNITFEKTTSFCEIPLDWKGGTINNAYNTNLTLTQSVSKGNYTTPQTIIYKTSSIAGRALSIPGANYNAATNKEDINIVLDNEDIGSHTPFVIKFAGSHEAKMTTVMEKNVNIYAKSAAALNFLNGCNANGLQKLNIKGGLQIIVNSDTKIASKIDDVTVFTDDTKKWFLTLEPSARGLLNFTETAGTYTVADNVLLQATNDKGETVYSSTDGKLILKDGNWSVTKKLVIHYGDSNSDGKINVLDLVHLKKGISNSKPYYSASDVNADKTVNSTDLVLIKKHLLGDKEIKWEDYSVAIPETLNLSGGANAVARRLKNSILSAKDNLTVTGTKYYVAENGSSSNNGSSENSPIRIEDVPSLSLKRGDAVLFKRGDTFRLTDTLNLKSGISYGAYGTGDKPQILGSFRDYADHTIWTSENGYLWQTQIEGNDAANLVFNNGKCIGERKSTLEEVKKDGDYHFDTETKTVYLFLNQHNPGHYFDSIEISSVRLLFFSTGSKGALISDITVDNISLKFAAVHSIGLNYGRNMKVTNCEMEWIGGAYFGTDGNRYGNGVEFWDIAEGNTVSNNYIHQVFDAAITFQGSNHNNYTNLTYENNLIEYCSMNFEFWASDSNNATDTSEDADAVIENINVKNNIFRFGGYGWGGLQRTGKSDQAFILAWFHYLDDEQVKNFNITDNTFDTANCNFFYGPNILKLLNISNNSFYQKAGSSFSVVRNKTFYSEDQASFETAIKSVDNNPKSIRWVS